MHCIARSNTTPDYNYLGEMNYICQHCGAKKFPDETHFLCCHNGKVVLSQPLSFPQDLEDLFKGNYADRNANLNFLKYIRNYNACLSFASFEATRFFLYKQLRILVRTRVAYFSANFYISSCLMVA